MTLPEDDFHAEEVLGERLEQYLSAKRGADSTLPTADSEELAELEAVVDRVDQWARSLAAAPRQGVPELPEAVGKYRILRQIGSGGQAQAWLAVDTELGRDVVLKVYEDQSAGAAQTAVSEARALASVRSRYVATCYGIEADQDTTYLVMECVPGWPLTEFSDRSHYSEQEIVDLIRKLAEGLAEIHRSGLLHADIKPSNILIGEDGDPKIIDFGLARSAHQQSSDSRGTAAYMAPEQARGELQQIDVRADIFALGAVFYELLTGGPLYEAQTKRETLRLAQQCDLTSAEEKLRGARGDIRQLCLQCLAEDPANRFQSARQVALALQATAQTRSWIGSSKAWLLTTAAAVVLLGMAWQFGLVWGTNNRSARVNSVPPAAQQARSWNEVMTAFQQPDGEPVANLSQNLQRDVEIIVRPAAYHVDARKMLLFEQGKDVHLTVRVDAACWLAVFAVELDAASDPVTYCLFPRTSDGSNHLESNSTIEITSEAPETSRGPELLYAVASTEEWDPRRSNNWIGSYPVYEFEIEPPATRSNLRSLRRQGDVGETLIPFAVLPTAALEARSRQPTVQTDTAD